MRGGHPMERVPASQKMRKEFEEVINGTSMSEFLLSEVVKRGAGIVLQEMFEAEVTDFLGRKHYERQDEGKESGYRNGYEPSKVKTA